MASHSTQIICIAAATQLVKEEQCHVKFAGLEAIACRHVFLAKL